tara:strand:+ start:116 stop:790 length:675 start_codon:yes stop_codon:yes gene_type:complete
MPTANTRITITPTSEAHAVLLTNWAILEGRTLSNLCSSLLENAINDSISKGTANNQALEMMNELINVRRNQLKFEYGKTLSLEQEKAENYLSEISAQAVDPEEESKFKEWTSRAEEAWDENSKEDPKKRDFFIFEPDVLTVSNYVKDLLFESEDKPKALDILTKASMAGCDLRKIYNAVAGIGKSWSSERLEALENICNAMIESKKLSLKPEYLSQDDNGSLPF